jgi:hypothetical protein
MVRWAFLLTACLVACSGGDEGEAARSALDNHRASLRVLGAATPPMTPRAGSGGQPGAAVPGRLGEGPAPRLASQFMGAGPETVLAALGEPSLRREEGGAMVWLYASGGCQLDIVLYRGPQGPRVAHVQARAGGLAQRTEAACLRDIASHAAGQDRRRSPAPPPELGA